MKTDAKQVTTEPLDVIQVLRLGGLVLELKNNGAHDKFEQKGKPRGNGATSAPLAFVTRRRANESAID